MKTKTLFLVVALFVTNVSFGQIEELSNVSGGTQQTSRFVSGLEKSDCPINLGEKMYNLIGMHLYNASKSPLIAIILENNSLRISPLESGETFEVTNIYSSKEILGMRASWQKAKFISEVIPYSINGKNFKRKTTKDDLDYFKPQYELRDNKGRTVYICATFVGQFCHDMNIADASAFICVETYNKLKEIYEGKEMASEYINYNKISFANGKYFSKDDVNPTNIMHIQKVAVMDGQLAAAVQFPNGKVENCAIANFGKASMHILHKNDSLPYLFVEIDRNPGRLGSSEGHILFTKADLDNLVLKWEQESLQEERAKLARDEKRKQELIAKYGQKYAQDIINGNPSVGMTKEMCLEACGNPNNGITKTTTSEGEQEGWTYGFYSRGYIYFVEITFVNGKITNIEEIEGNTRY